MSRGRSQFEKAKGRREAAPFARLPRATLKCEAVRSLSHLEFRLLCVAAGEMDGGNNGDLNLARPTLEAYGLSRGSHLQAAIATLLDRGLLALTRQGERRRCALYAVAWHELTKDPKRLAKLDRPLPMLPDTRYMKWTAGEISSSGDARSPKWRREVAITAPEPPLKTGYGDLRSPNEGELWRPEVAPSKTLPGGSAETVPPPGPNGLVPKAFSGRAPVSTSNGLAEKAAKMREAVPGISDFELARLLHTTPEAIASLTAEETPC